MYILLWKHTLGTYLGDMVQVLFIFLLAQLYSWLNRVTYTFLRDIVISSWKDRRQQTSTSSHHNLSLTASSPNQYQGRDLRSMYGFQREKSSWRHDTSVMKNFYDRGWYEGKEWYTASHILMVVSILQSNSTNKSNQKQPILTNLQSSVLKKEGLLYGS